MPSLVTYDLYLAPNAKQKSLDLAQYELIQKCTTFRRVLSIKFLKVIITLYVPISHIDSFNCYMQYFLYYNLPEVVYYFLHTEKQTGVFYFISFYLVHV